MGIAFVALNLGHDRRTDDAAADHSADERGGMGAVGTAQDEMTELSEHIDFEMETIEIFGVVVRPAFRPWLAEGKRSSCS